MTSDDLTKPKTNTESTVKRISNRRNKNSFKFGSMHENVRTNDEYLEEILLNNNI